MPSRPAPALLTGLVLAPLLLTGCSGDDPDAAAQTAPSTSAAPSSAAAPATGTPAAPAAGGTTALRAFVGTEDDPEAFEIGLTDGSGAAVTSVPAGTYEIEVEDRSTIHNFAISGDGVDEATSVSERESVTFTVTLRPGTYTFVCDPHPSMSGTLTVT